VRRNPWVNTSRIGGALVGGSLIGGLLFELPGVVAGGASVAAVCLVMYGLKRLRDHDHHPNARIP